MTHHARTMHRRGGFTIIEMMVSISIISLLVAMLLPVIQASRENSRIVTCTSNLRQVGLACNAYESTHRRYPSYLDWKGSGFSGHVQLLAFLGYENVSNSLVSPEYGRAAADPPTVVRNSAILSTRISVLTCPSDGNESLRVSYRACFGTTPGIHADWRPGRGPLLNPTSKALWGILNGARHPGEVIDGLSHTVLYSERVSGDGMASRYSPWTDVASVPTPLASVSGTVNACSNLPANQSDHFSSSGFTWMIGMYEHSAYNHILPPNSNIPDCVSGMTQSRMGNGAIAARSYHRGHCQISLADGSVRKISQEIELSVWRSLSTIHGDEVLDAF